MKRTPLKKQSARKKLRDIIGKLHLEILKKERGNYYTCELCGKHTTLGRFHILPVGVYPRLEFHSENILLAGWMCCHQHWHHDYNKGKAIEKNIMRLRGENYREKLLILNRSQPRHTDMYLSVLCRAFEKRLKELT